MTKIHDHVQNHPPRPAPDRAHNRREKAKADEALAQAKHYAGGRPSFIMLADEIKEMLSDDPSLLDSEFGGLLANIQNFLARASNEQDALGYKPRDINRLLRRIDKALETDRLPFNARRLLRQANHKFDGLRGTRQADGWWNQDNRPDQSKGQRFHIQPYPGPQDILANWQQNHAADLRLNWANHAANMAPWAAHSSILEAANQFQPLADRYKSSSYGSLVNRVQDMLARGSVYGDGLGYQYNDVNNLLRDIQRTMMPGLHHQGRGPGMGHGHRPGMGHGPGMGHRPGYGHHQPMPADLQYALMQIIPLLQQMMSHLGEPGADMPKTEPVLDYSDGF